MLCFTFESKFLNNCHDQNGYELFRVSKQYGHVEFSIIFDRGGKNDDYISLVTFLLKIYQDLDMRFLSDFF